MKFELECCEKCAEKMCRLSIKVSWFWNQKTAMKIEINSWHKQNFHLGIVHMLRDGENRVKKGYEKKWFKKEGFKKGDQKRE